MFLKSTLVAAALLGMSAVEGHMIMSQPVPYGKDTLNNSPLAADGSDFPCKLRSNTYQVTQWNTGAVGESMPLTFTGSAVHGGGSCQISLTTDLEPTKDSEWMVIKSFEGGCPANVAGNLPANANGADPFTFNYTIPEGISPGKYTLAWTWFNRIGNREMYMNCAPLEVTGSSSKRSRVMSKLEERSSTFPPMFVANINGCTTKEGVDIRFPQPGDYVAYLGEASNLAPEGSAACTGTPTFAAAGDTSSGTSSGTSSASSAAAAISSAVVANANTGSYQSSTTAPAINTAYAAPPAASSASSESYSGTSSGASSQSSSAVSSSGSSSAGTSTSGALSGSCSSEGSWNCIGGSSFQRCANGQWTTAQAMASGTQCTPGQSDSLSIASAMSKRDVTEMRARRRAQGGHRHV
ncbi:lytic polysaccharide monooxygenase AA11 family protein [Aspergillus saccharolyticus JOP 1030-1]|uniref:Endoglucanase n=1 Tax=Aspergillus saccharolyticus JOP 1030-1 TaxID=1450539 RepID=A0A318ZE11_9EURO|nr:endoglucanase [Aspergillus saccharolyticus JOP 1030-1]PYH45766.1 endoglucanase [Aspergillus saccharolyticus JOP 1030-1]